MKPKMKGYLEGFLVLLLLWILVLLFAPPQGRWLGAVFMLVVLVLTIFKLHYGPKPTHTEILDDELSARIKEKASYKTCLIILLMTFIIHSLHSWELSPSLTPSKDFVNGVLVLAAIGSLSFVIAFLYYRRKGVLK